MPEPLEAIDCVDEAFAALERGVDAREGDAIQLSMDPGFAPLRNDPRGRALLQRMNLAH